MCIRDSQLAAAAQGKAAHRGDGGDGKGLQFAEHIVAQLAEGFALRFGKAAHLPDIGAGDKGLLSLAGDHQAADAVQVDAVQSFIQFPDDLIVQSIQRGGTVDGQNANVPFRGEFDICLLYTSPSPRDS